MSSLIPLTCSVPQGSVLGPTLFISYTDDVPSVFQRHQVNRHLYADDVSRARTALQHCISDISSRCSPRHLQLNATKTELIWFGSCQMLQRLSDHDLTLEVGISVIQPVKCVRDLSVHLDSELTDNENSYL